ncbi:hypothetical protein A5705_16530 [Mycobacterium sp. E787]|nr:hypothetical protein A5705_16530 [Mycobacterium sp. E787]
MLVRLHVGRMPGRDARERRLWPRSAANQRGARPVAPIRRAGGIGGRADIAADGGRRPPFGHES